MVKPKLKSHPLTWQDLRAVFVDSSDSVSVGLLSYLFENFKDNIAGWQGNLTSWQCVFCVLSFLLTRESSGATYLPVCLQAGLALVFMHIFLFLSGFFVWNSCNSGCSTLNKNLMLPLWNYVSISWHIIFLDFTNF